MKLMPCILLYFVVGCSVGLVPEVYSSGETNGTETNAHVIQRGSFYCIPVKCEINNFFILCNSNNSAKPGKDECIPCGKNTFNPNRTNTGNILFPDQVPKYQVCRKPDCYCGSEGIALNGVECHTNASMKMCICNAKIGYCGDDYKNCVQWNESDIGKDYELTPNCTIKKCEKGYSKPVGYGACEKDDPSTKIPTTGTGTTQPTTPSTSGASGTDVHNNSTEATNTTTSSINEEEDDGLVLKIVLPIMAAVLLAIIIGIVWFVRKRRGMIKKGNRDGNPGNQNMNGNHELMRMV